MGKKGRKGRGNTGDAPEPVRQKKGSTYGMYSKGRKSKDDSHLVDPASREFVYGETDDFIDQQDQQDWEGLEDVLPKRKEQKEQILGLNMDSDEDDDEDEDDEESDEDEDAMLMDEDLVEEREEREADDRAWGTKKAMYHGTDTTDERIHKKLYREDEELARLEEETARRLQDRMAAELQDLMPEDLLPQEETDKAGNALGEVEADISGMTKSQKLQLLKRESPEFLPLIEDMKRKCDEVQVLLRPLMKAVADGHIASGPQREYVTTKYRLTLNYITVLSVYLVMKSSQRTVSGHPVVARLAQYRQLLKEMEVCDEKMGPKLIDLLSEVEAGRKPRGSAKDKTKKRKTLKLLNKKQEEVEEEAVEAEEAEALSDDEDNEDEEEDEYGEGDGSGKRKVGSQGFPLDKRARKEGKRAKPNTGKASLANIAGDEDEDPEGRRGISYQIAKNKGLTAYKRKDQQNPRVNYKRKFKTKTKKRIGQVRDVRREDRRYEGETTGIKAYTVKSRKLS